MTGAAVAVLLAAASVCCASIGVLAAVVYVIRHHLVNRAASMSLALKNPQKMRGSVLYLNKLNKLNPQSVKNTAKTHIGLS